MKKKVIAIFDIGKTNKKILLFDENLKVVSCIEEEFKTSVDEDSVECDDIDLIEVWMKSTLEEIIKGDEFELKAVNFSTYGASLAFLDEVGQRLTPIYNYLKEVPESIQSELFEKYGGEEEFCRKTASPKLGLLLNSGIQMLWLKKEKPEVFNKVKSILHFPQYLSYLLTNKVVSEPTSIGCHTFMWDFDSNCYHEWIKNEGFNLPEPIPNTNTFATSLAGKDFVTGIGIHDSSSSLVPYLKGSKEKFILVSTGTWCINMNPFNNSPLSSEQLKNDCLSNLSIEQQAVKSSRLFMGYIHDVNTDYLCSHFQVDTKCYKEIETDSKLIEGFLKLGKTNKVFFEDGMPKDYVDKSVDLSQFKDFKEAYHRLMFDLAILDAESIDLVSDDGDGTKSIYVSGGFARNEIFVRMLATLYPNKEVFTTEIDNSSAMGAALVIWDSIAGETLPDIDLGLKKWKSF